MVGSVIYGRRESDHIHLLLELNPRAAPAIAANNLKTVTSRLLRKEFGPALARTYSQPVLWSRSYFVASCGGCTIGGDPPVHRTTRNAITTKNCAEGGYVQATALGVGESATARQLVSCCSMYCLSTSSEAPPTDRMQ